MIEIDSSAPTTEQENLKPTQPIELTQPPELPREALSLPLEVPGALEPRTPNRLTPESLPNDIRRRTALRMLQATIAAGMVALGVKSLQPPTHTDIPAHNNAGTHQKEGLDQSDPIYTELARASFPRGAESSDFLYTTEPGFVHIDEDGYATSVNDLQSLNIPDDLISALSLENYRHENPDQSFRIRNKISAEQLAQAIPEDDLKGSKVLFPMSPHIVLFHPDNSVSVYECNTFRLEDDIKVISVFQRADVKRLTASALRDVEHSTGANLQNAPDRDFYATVDLIKTYTFFQQLPSNQRDKIYKALHAVPAHSYPADYYDSLGFYLSVLSPEERTEFLDVFLHAADTITSSGDHYEDEEFNDLVFALALKLKLYAQEDEPFTEQADELFRRYRMVRQSKIIQYQFTVGSLETLWSLRTHSDDEVIQMFADLDEIIDLFPDSIEPGSIMSQRVDLVHSILSDPHPIDKINHYIALIHEKEAEFPYIDPGMRAYAIYRLSQALGFSHPLFPEWKNKLFATMQEFKQAEGIGGALTDYQLVDIVLALSQQGVDVNPAMIHNFKHFVKFPDAAKLMYIFADNGESFDGIDSPEAVVAKLAHAYEKQPSTWLAIQIAAWVNQAHEWESRSQGSDHFRELFAQSLSPAGAISFIAHAGTQLPSTYDNAYFAERDELESNVPAWEKEEDTGFSPLKERIRGEFEPPDVQFGSANYGFVMWTSTFMVIYNQLKTTPPEEYVHVLQSRPDLLARYAHVLGRFGKLEAEIQQYPEIYIKPIRSILTQDQEYSSSSIDDMFVFVDGIVAGIRSENPDISQAYQQIVVDAWRKGAFNRQPDMERSAIFIMKTTAEQFKAGKFRTFFSTWNEAYPDIEVSKPPDWSTLPEIKSYLYYNREDSQPGREGLPNALHYLTEVHGFTLTSQSSENFTWTLEKQLPDGRKIVVEIGDKSMDDLMVDGKLPYQLVGFLAHSYHRGKFHRGTIMDASGSVIYLGSCGGRSELVPLVLQTKGRYYANLDKASGDINAGYAVPKLLRDFASGVDSWPFLSPTIVSPAGNGQIMLNYISLRNHPTSSPAGEKRIGSTSMAFGRPVPANRSPRTTPQLIAVRSRNAGIAPHKL